MLFGTRETFDYMRCPDCGVLRIVEIPADMSPYYPPDYYDGAELPAAAPARGGLTALADGARNRRALFGTDRRLARVLRPWASASGVSKHERMFVRRLGLRSFDDPVLDVGCGRRATNLLELKRLGFRSLLGVDPFLEQDGEYEGIPLRRRAIHDVEGSFQAITFHHSFEHVSDPRTTLEAAAARLRPDGTVLVRTPVFGSWFWEVFGTAWWELDPPRHLYVHTRASLERLAGAVGLELEHVEWDSTFLELIASTQIARDIAWREPASWKSNPPAGFDDATIERFKRKVATLNAGGTAGRAGFYFRRRREADGVRHGLMAGVGSRLRSSGRLVAVVRGVRGLFGATPTRRSSSTADAVAGAGARTGPGASAGPGAGSPEDIVRELLRVAARPSAMTEHRLNLVIPTLDPAAAFGGIRTAVDLYRNVASVATNHRIISLSPFDAVAAEEALPGYRAVPPEEDPADPRQLVAVLPASDVMLPVGPRDVFIATFWTTAELVLRIRRWQEATYGAAPPRFAYLIQDFEPGFYPWSAQHVLARATYDEPDSTIAVFNTSLLRDYVHEAGIRFANEFVFEPRLPAALRAVRDRQQTPRDRRIVVYGRPQTPRNAFPLIVEGLRDWRARQPRAADWSVVSAGQDHPDVDLGGGRFIRSVGKLDIGAYGDLLKRSGVGLSLMYSPHPSYPPLEMAHLGMLVLTNRFDGKDLATWHTNIVSLGRDTSDGIGEELAALCRRIELDPQAGERGTTLRPDYLGDAPQFPFATEVAALLQSERA
jgi:SAM-dependent methyltransferase